MSAPYLALRIHVIDLVDQKFSDRGVVILAGQCEGRVAVDVFAVDLGSPLVQELNQTVVAPSTG